VDGDVDGERVGSDTETPLSAEFEPFPPERAQRRLAHADARAFAIRDDSKVTIERRWSHTRARARASTRIAAGTAFLSFHHPDTHTNAVTGPQRDGESNCPEYKVTAVRIRSVET